VGVDRAVEAGQRAVGAQTLASALVRLDGRFLSGATRTGLKTDGHVLASLREQVGVTASPAR
jgi:hypothetical protein